jgi:hypothetical protein
LILSGPNLFPNVVELEAHNQFKFSPYDGINKTMDIHHHRLRLGLSQIQADIRDVSFAFRRKKGWPKISDRGLADVVIAGKGISVEVDIETVHNRRDSVFRVRNVKTQVDTLTFSIRDSKHNLLYKFIRATATGVIKKAIAAAVSVAIRTALGHLDDQLTEIRNNVEEAKKSDENTRTQALKDLYARKKETAKANAEEAKHQAEEKPGKFKIVANRDSMVSRLGDVTLLAFLLTFRSTPTWVTTPRNLLSHECGRPRISHTLAGSGTRRLSTCSTSNTQLSPATTTQPPSRVPLQVTA